MAGIFMPAPPKSKLSELSIRWLRVRAPSASLVFLEACVEFADFPVRLHRTSYPVEASEQGWLK